MIPSVFVDFGYRPFFSQKYFHDFRQLSRISSAYPRYLAAFSVKKGGDPAVLLLTLTVFLVMCATPRLSKQTISVLFLRVLYHGTKESFQSQQPFKQEDQELDRVEEGDFLKI